MHNPDFSATVTARRVGEEMVELLALGAVSLMSGWRTVWRPGGEPSRQSLHNAIRRLERKGLVIRKSDGPEDPVLMLTDAADRFVDASLRPERRWGSTWSGRWSLFSYDVPERRRGSRQALRGFLKRLRLGCLHQSLWVTPFDIRPDYDDLCKAAAITDVGRLFEAHTVLGARAMDIVYDAWPWGKIEREQLAYLQAVSKIGTPRDPSAAARIDSLMYRNAMKADPLLPRDLWPRGYAGERCWKAHREAQARLRPGLFGALADVLAPAERKRSDRRPSKITFTQAAGGGGRG